MRRIYDSQAIARDDDESFKPRERRRRTQPQSFRSLDSSVWSDRLLPHRLRRWAVTVDISTPAREFERGEQVPFRVEMHNRLPVPVTIETPAAVPWHWTVDGAVEASRVPPRDPPAIESDLQFDRGERRRFTKRWSGRFKVADSEWVTADPGEHTIAASVNVTDADAAALTAATTVRLVA